MVLNVYLCFCMVLEVFLCVCMVLEVFLCVCMVLEVFLCVCMVLEVFLCVCMVLEVFLCVCMVLEVFLCVCMVLEVFLCVCMVLDDGCFQVSYVFVCFCELKSFESLRFLKHVACLGVANVMRSVKHVIFVWLSLAFFLNFAAGSVAASMACACCPSDSWPRAEDDYKAKGHMSSIGDLPVYVSGKPGPRGILVYQELFGLNGNLVLLKVFIFVWLYIPKRPWVIWGLFYFFADSSSKSKET